MRTGTYWSVRIEAGNGLAARIDGDGTVRIEWGEVDWFGPGRLTRGGVPTPIDGDDPTVDEIDDDIGHARIVTVHRTGVAASVRAYRDLPMLVFRLQSTTELDELATGSFAEPYVGWPVFTPAERDPDGVDPAARALAFQCCEFAFPTGADASLDRFFLLPHRPATGWPLLLSAADGRTLLIAPLDAFHDQTIGLNGGTVRCGWHGDLESVPAGFTTDLARRRRRRRALVHGRRGARCCSGGPARCGPAAGPTRSGSRPSYWTDNGAAYWYRTEPGHDPPARSSPRSTTCATAVCPSARCSSTRGGTPTPSCARSTPTSGSCHRRR